MKRILMLLSNAFAPDPRVHREAMALIAAGYEVTILCWDRDCNSPVEEIVDGIRLQRIHLASTHGRGASQIAYLIAFWIKAFSTSRQQEFDIVHAHDFDTLPLGYILARWKGAKLVYDSHESYVDMVHSLPVAIRKAIFHTENFLLKRVDLVITVGDILKEFLSGRGGRNICVVGNWQDPDKFIFNEQELSVERQQLGVQSGQKVIAFIANLGTERRIPELIAAVSQTSDTFLVLGGNGPCAEQATKAAAKFENIAYLGYVQPQRVPFYTALADIVFYGFDPDNPNARFSAPNKLFECLAAGKAMLTGDFGEIGRIVREASCGVIIPDYEIEHIRAAIDSLSGDILQEYGNNARQAAEHRYCWKRAGEILLTNYLTLTAVKSRAHTGAPIGKTK